MRNHSFIFLLMIAFFVLMCGCEKPVQEIDAVEITMLRKQPLLPIIPNGVRAVPDEFIVTFDTLFFKPALNRLSADKFADRTEKVEKMKKLSDEVQEEIDEWLTKLSIDKKQVISYFTAIQCGIVIRCDRETIQRIAYRRELASIEQNFEYERPKMIETAYASYRSAAQETPCAITQANGWGTPNQNYWIWIIDSGIDLDHPDLNVYDWAGADATDDGVFSLNDTYGHGTYVAGIAAAKNNTIGIVGVAAGAPVVPVNIHSNDYFYSQYDAIVRGLNHIAAWSTVGDVCNLSIGPLGEYTNCGAGTAMRTHMIALANKGIRFTISAGNNIHAIGANEFPHCLNHSNIFTVASMTCNKQWFAIGPPNDGNPGSAYGIPPVDWIAVGKDVKSTKNNGGYGIVSGTSIAAPIVAGILQLRHGGAPHYNPGNHVTFKGKNYKIAWR